MTLLFNVTKVGEVMTRNPELISPSATLREAAQKMESVRCGVLPVGTRDKLNSIITDRDIVVRAVAQGKNPASEKVSSFMSGEVYDCDEDDSIEEASEKMREHRVSRLIVRDSEG